MTREQRAADRDRLPGARGREHAIRALLGSLLAVTPFSVGMLVDAVRGTADAPLASDPAFAAIAAGSLALLAALASIPVGAVTYLLDRGIERVWISRPGRLAAGVVMNGLIGAGAGLALGGFVAPMWRPLERALVFTGPWAGAAVLLLLLAAARGSGRRTPRAPRS